MIAIQYPHLISDTDRHGNVRYYVRCKGVPKVRLRSTPGTAEFEADYRAALRATAQPAPRPHVTREGTWRWLCQHYMRSAAYKALHPSTQDRRLRDLQSTWAEPRKQGAPEHIADMLLSRMDERVIAILRDRKASNGLDAANQRLKAMRAVFSWAKEAGLVIRNPARDVRSLRTGSEGIHAWTEAEIEKYKAKHPLGTQAHLALMIYLLTGVRRSDAVKLGRQHEDRALDGSETLTFTVAKNERNKPMRVQIPLLPELRKVLDASPTGSMTYLVTAHGKPFSVKGLGNKVREWCNQAGLPECSSHGLRKAAATTAANNGATEHQLMAMFAWITPDMARLYTRTANRDKLAVSGMPLVVRR